MRSLFLITTLIASAFASTTLDLSFLDEDLHDLQLSFPFEEQPTFEEEITQKIVAGRSPIIDDAFNDQYVFTGSQVGRGSNGIVFEAKHRSTAELVAVKFTLTLMEDEISCELVVEVYILMQAQQHGVDVLRYISCGRQGKSMLYIVTELITLNGKSSNFDKYLVEYGPLHYSQSINYLHQLSNTFMQLHAIDIAVNDIKPENMLLSDNHKLTAIDFGNSVVTLGEKMTDNNQGTSTYRSPQAARVAYTGTGVYDIYSNDVYSLGVCYLKMIIGDLLFDHADLTDYVEHSDFTAYSPHTDTILRNMLARNETLRWTMRDVKEFIDTNLDAPLVVYTNEQTQSTFNDGICAILRTIRADFHESLLRTFKATRFDEKRRAIDIKSSFRTPTEFTIAWAEDELGKLYTPHSYKLKDAHMRLIKGFIDVSIDRALLSKIHQDGIISNDENMMLEIGMFTIDCVWQRAFHLLRRINALALRHLKRIGSVIKMLNNYKSSQLKLRALLLDMYRATGIAMVQRDVAGILTLVKKLSATAQENKEMIEKLFGLVKASSDI